VNGLRPLDNVYGDTYMPIFLERFVLPVLATSVITVILLNPFKWDWRQRTSLFVAVIALAYFVGYSLTKGKPAISPLVGIAPTAPQSQVNQRAGDCSANASGDDNTQSVNCDEKDRK